MKKRLVLFFVAPLLLFSSFSTIFMCNPVFADTDIASVATAGDKRLKAFLYLAGIYNCLSTFTDNDLADSVMLGTTALSQVFIKEPSSGGTGYYAGSNILSDSIVTCKSAADEFYKLMTGSPTIAKSTVESLILKDVYKEDTSSVLKKFQCKYTVVNTNSNGYLDGDYYWPQGKYDPSEASPRQWPAYYLPVAFLNLPPITLYYSTTTGITKLDSPHFEWSGSYDAWGPKDYKFINSDYDYLLQKVKDVTVSSDYLAQSNNLADVCHTIITKKVRPAQFTTETSGYTGLNNFNAFPAWDDHSTFWAFTDYNINMFNNYSAVDMGTENLNGNKYNIVRSGAVAKIKSNIEKLYLNDTTPTDYVTNKDTLLKYQLLGRYLFNGDTKQIYGCNGVTMSKEDARLHAGDKNSPFDTGNNSTTYTKAFVPGETTKQEFVTHFGVEGSKDKVEKKVPFLHTSSVDCTTIAQAFNDISFSTMATNNRSTISAVFSYIMPSKFDADPNADPDNPDACLSGYTMIAGVCQKDGTNSDGSDIFVDTSGEEVQSTCNIGAIGWIICPVLNVMGGLAENLYEWVADNFLSIPSTLFSGGSSTNGLRSAWGAFRDIANAVFVILFLIVIFSQITGFGISNYGIKAIMPKLIITIILINLSYFICQLAVDLSNIVGNQIYYFLRSMGDNIMKPIRFTVKDDGTGAAGVAGGIIGGVLAVVLVGAAWANFGALALLLIAVLVSALTIFVLLALRQALVVLLVAISPIAFVCYMLPNTKTLFGKWLTVFKAMLMLYPICGMMVGAGYLASAVLQKSSNGNIKLDEKSAMDGIGDVSNSSSSSIPIDTDNIESKIIEGGTGKSWVLLIVASSLRFLPLLAIPSVLKGSMNAVGNIGAKINGASAKINGAAGNRFKNSRVGMAATSHDKQVATNKMMRKAGLGKNPLRYGNKFLNSLPGLRRGSQSMINQGISAQAQQEADEIKNRKSLYKVDTKAHAADMAKIKSGRASNSVIAAALEHAGDNGDQDKVSDILASMGSMNASQQTKVRDTILSHAKIKEENVVAKNFAKNMGTYAGNYNTFLASGTALKDATQNDYNNLDKDVIDRVATADAGSSNHSFNMDKVASSVAGGSKDSVADSYKLNVVAADATNVNAFVNAVTPEHLSTMTMDDARFVAGKGNLRLSGGTAVTTSAASAHASSRVGLNARTKRDYLADSRLHSKRSAADNAIISGL